VNKSNVNTLKDKLKPAPMGLIMASLLLWGWQTEYLIYAIVIGVLLELPRFIKWRIDFSDKDINQLADLSGVIFFILAVTVFINYSFHGIYKILELLPFALLLLMLAQNYSVQNSIKTSALFISVRRLGANASPDILYQTNISLPYVFLCLISASSGNKYSDYFFILSSLIIIWMLWHFRSKQYSLVHWLMPILIVIGLSYVAQNGLKQLQANAEILFLELFEQYGIKSRNPDHTSTSIGSLGRLKLSDRIIFRIKSEKKFATPLYFRETSYSQYEYGSWRNPKVEFDIIEKIPLKKEWRFNKGLNDLGNMDVGILLDDQSAIIPVPDNINSLSGKDLIQVETSVFGSTRIEARQGWINYRLGYSSKDFIEKAPTENDLSIPLHYQNDFKQVATELELYSKSPEEIITSVNRYFNQNFFYSITQNQRYTRGQYLTKFLFKDKKGHCEYFATATALLLREAGIPTRYTIGYSVQEYSPWQGMYLVRARHAHAWTKYYLNGKWQNMDTTPAIWAPMEAEDRTILEPFMDLLSWLRYKTTGGDIDSEQQETNNWILWLLIPLGAYLAWRFYKQQRIEQKKLNNTFLTNVDRFGLDSPLYPLINHLEQEADTRQSGETLTSWIKRILPKSKTESYLELIKLHNDYRFNPVSDKQKDKLLIKKSMNSLVLKQ
jgi:protein-glutamine gamma-glutamyltransferase